MDREQVIAIRREVRKRGLNFTYVEEEAVDFISCQIEALLEAGLPFDQAYDQAFRQAADEGMFNLKTKLITPKAIYTMDIFSNYLKVAYRNLVKHKVNSLVNVFGLLIALSSVIFIALYVSKEFSYDKFIPENGLVYRVNGTSYMGDTPQSSNYVSPLLIDAMLEEIPQIEFAASGLALSSPNPFEIDGQAYYDLRIDYFKKDVFEIFGINVLDGSLEMAYNQPYGLMISKSKANQLFADEDPIGKKVEADFRNKPIVFTIYGVFEDLPEESHLSYSSYKMEIIASQESWELIGGGKGRWNSTHMPAYVKVADGSDYKEVEQKINELLIRRAGEDIFYRHYLQPVGDIHLNTLGLPTDSQGDLNQVITFSLIGLLILVIACINYINLVTARITVRMKEVGVRKVLGAGRAQFLLQFIVEAFLLTMFSLIISIILVSLSLSALNDSFDLSLSLSLLENAWLLLGLFIILFVVSIISGGYPGIYLSRFTSSNLLRNTLNLGNARFTVRKLLVVLQFAISAAIIVCTIVVVRQLDFLRSSDLGYDQENIVYIDLPWRDISTKGVLFKQELEKLSVVKSASMTNGSFAKGNFSGNGIRVGMATESSMQRILPVDFNYLETMGIEIIKGRWFDPNLTTDVKEGFVINEAFLDYFDITDPIGLKLQRNDQEGEIIGVAKDFHWKSMHNEIEPLVMFMDEGYSSRYGNIALKLNAGSLKEAEEQIRKVWQGIFQDRPFSWEFLDQQLEMSYQKDKVFGGIFTVFSVMAIVISCLGLLGLVSFSVERRLKEIGIRKVLGASISGILLLISKDFSKLVLIGFALSVPAAYFFISKWLDNFQYRIELDYWPFVLACFLTVFIAWISVSYISLRAAKSNPIDSLKTE